jgi:ATP-dependent protease ClpP protease subunit
MNFIQIENKKGKVSFNDTVNPASIDKMIEEMRKVFGATAAMNGIVTGEITACIENAADTLNIEINSPGGSVFDGYRAFHEIKQMRQRGVYVVATINALAASMGSVIAMACDEIRMVEGGRMMIHEASQGIHGDAAAHARAAKILDEISSEIASIYANKTGGTVDAMRELMLKETWMGATEALQLGFIDSIISLTVMQNDMDTNANLLQKQNSNNMKLLDRLIGPSNEEIISQLEAVKIDLASLEAELKSETDKNSLAESALQEAATEVSNLRKQVKEVETIKAEKAKIESDLLAEQSKTTPEAIQALVTAQIVASGHPALVIEGPGSVTPPIAESKEMSIGDFRNLKPADQMKFVKSGGKLIN